MDMAHDRRDLALARGRGGGRLPAPILPGGRLAPAGRQCRGSQDSERRPARRGRHSGAPPAASN